jgi:hypothetical protein
MAILLAVAFHSIPQQFQHHRPAHAIAHASDPNGLGQNCNGHRVCR